MCLLCAAVPATLALGAADQAKHVPEGSRPRLPISVRAGVLVVALVVAAVFYHTRGLVIA